jgi:glycosyltransferase involved in cell wall biosynthesis
MSAPVGTVLHLGTNDITGGAARAAYRLHAGLRQLGVPSRMLVRQKASDDPDVLIAARHPEATWHRAWRKAAPYLDDVPRRLLRTSNITPISPAWLPGPTAGDINRLSPAIVNLHWICGGFLAPENLPRMRAPLVWTLHDQWAFCGGEHYTGEDRRFAEGYRADNRPPDEGGLDVNRWVWNRKRRTYGRIDNLVAVAPSRWLHGLAAASVLFHDRRIVHIPYGIDHLRFQPIDRALARHLLGLAPDRRIILFGAFGGINNPRKDFKLLAAALRAGAADGKFKNTELVIFGSGAEGVAADVGITASALGVLHDDISLALVYSAADIYVATTTADNLPLSVMEAMACGTPVAGVDVGGMADLVRDGETGRLVARDPAALAGALDWMLADGDRLAQLGSAARATIEREFTSERQAAQYLSLYQDLLGTAAASVRPPRAAASS